MNTTKKYVTLKFKFKQFATHTRSLIRSHNKLFKNSHQWQSDRYQISNKKLRSTLRICGKRMSVVLQFSNWIFDVDLEISFNFHFQDCQVIFHAQRDSRRWHMAIVWFIILLKCWTNECFEFDSVRIFSGQCWRIAAVENRKMEKWWKYSNHCVLNECFLINGHRKLGSQAGYFQFVRDHAVIQRGIMD